VVVVRVLTFVHHPNAAAGVFADPARVSGHELVGWLPHEASPPELDGFGAAIVFGGAMQVDQEDAHPWLRHEKQLLRGLIERGTPVLGICFGSQLVAEVAGAVVRRAPRAEIGWHQIELTPEGRDDPLLGFLPERFESFQWHYYEWLLPPGATELARSDQSLQAFRLDGRPVWGLQFHPEVAHADLDSWFDTWSDDPDALASGLDPVAIRTESATKIGAWNDLGREVAARFLAVAAEAGYSSGVR
jgi:GMP synthase (glutamine-hydrolysing)